VPARDLVVLGLTLAGGALILAGAVPVLTLAMALFAVLGAPVVGWMVGLQTMIQQATADAYRGRILGAFGALSTSFLLVGVGIASSFGGAWDVQWLLVLAGALFVLAGAIAFVRVPRAAVAATTQLEPAVG
jgi:hypothetical protein